MNKPTYRIILIFAALLVAGLACNFTPDNESDDRNATVEALSTSVAGTTTAIAQESLSTQPVQEVIPTVPQAAVPAQPTIDLQATEMAGQMAATEAALAPIKAELASYGVDPNAGQIGFIHPPLRLEVDQYMGKSFGNNFANVVAQDFVLSADITWDTEYGAAGCALVFRSDGDQSKPNQYMVWMTRLTSGRVEFTVFAEGQIVGIHDFYANGIDPDFNGANGAVNKLAIVGRGLKFDIYTNGTKLGVGDPNAPLPPIVLPEEPIPPSNISDPAAREAYERALAEYRATVSRLKNEYNNRVALAKKANKNFPAGITVFGAVAESGRTMCEFNNAWLWLMAP